MAFPMVTGMMTLQAVYSIMQSGRKLIDITASEAERPGYFLAVNTTTL
jgi:hypothetical protein